MEPQHIQDLAYGQHQRQCLDLYLPAQDTPAGLYLYYHGGGFIGGDKCCISMNLVKACNEAGIAVASANYRLAEDAPYPAAMEDGLAAFEFLRTNAAEFNLDPQRFAIGGGSAGSGIAFWIGFNHPDKVRCIASRGAQTSYDLNFAAEHISDTFTWHPAVKQFFQITDENFDSPETLKIFKENHYIGMVTNNTPPVFISYNSFNTPLESVSSPEELIHHPMFGILLKEKMDEQQVECIIMTRDNLPENILEEAIPIKLQEETINFLKKYIG